MTPDLNAVQMQLTRYLFEDDQPLPQGLAGSEEHLRRRLRVYRNNIFYSLTTALADLYPVVQALVGEAFFRVTARHYLQEFPPRQAAMVNFGGEFPDFLQREEVHSGLVYLADIARLELARHQSFHAVDACCLAPDLVQKMDAEQLLDSKFTLHPSLRLQDSQWAIHSIWLAHQAEQIELGDIQLDEPESVLILRPATRANIYRIEPGLVKLLSLLGGGITLAEAIESTLPFQPSFNIGNALAFCFKQGTFSDLHPPL